MCPLCLDEGVVFVTPNAIGGPVIPCPQCLGIQPNTQDSDPCRPLTRATSRHLSCKYNSAAEKAVLDFIHHCA